MALESHVNRFGLLCERDEEEEDQEIPIDRVTAAEVNVEENGDIEGQGQPNPAEKKEEKQESVSELSVKTHCTHAKAVILSDHVCEANAEEALGENMRKKKRRIKSMADAKTADDVLACDDACEPAMMEEMKAFEEEKSSAEEAENQDHQKEEEREGLVQKTKKGEPRREIFSVDSSSFRRAIRALESHVNQFALLCDRDEEGEDVEILIDRITAADVNVQGNGYIEGQGKPNLAEKREEKKGSFSELSVTPYCTDAKVVILPGHVCEANAEKALGQNKRKKKRRIKGMTDAKNIDDVLACDRACESPMMEEMKAFEEDKSSAEESENADDQKEEERGGLAQKTKKKKPRMKKSQKKRRRREAERRRKLRRGGFWLLVIVISLIYAWRESIF